MSVCSIEVPPNPTRFSAPAFHQELRVEDYVERVPRDATIRGLFLNAVLEPLGPRRQELAAGKRRIVPFKNYPLSDQVRLIPEVASRVYPDLTIREGIRRLGHEVYPAFAQSLLGRVLFSTVGNDPLAMTEAGCKAFCLAASVGTVKILDLRTGHAQLHLREMYNYIDCYQVGVVEGAFSVLGIRTRFGIWLDDPTAGVFDLCW